MKKIFNKITIVVIAITLVFASVALSGCNRVNIVFAWYEGSSEYDNMPIVMMSGDEFEVTRSHFDHLNIEFERFEIWVNVDNGVVGNPIENSTVVAIEGNTVTAGNSGHVLISATLTMPREGNTRQQWGVWLAWIYVVNEATMTHITTPEELAAMNDNLSGHFILMADIDLAGIEWTPIGQSTLIAECVNCANRVQGLRCECRAFRGIFANPHGYTISNLTISTKETGIDFGLFGLVYRHTLISGIILDGVNINISDYKGIHGFFIGGLVGTMRENVIINNVFVNGIVAGKGIHMGGIVGFSNGGLIANSSFEGSIKATGAFTDPGFSVGGIVGVNASPPRFGATIINCLVDANIYGGEFANVGGVAGRVHYRYSIIGSSFTGGLERLTGRNVGTKFGSQGHPMFGGPINFD